MSTSRWKYKTKEVDVGGNSQTVRELTQRDYQDMLSMHKKVTAGEATMMEVTNFVVQRGAINPELSLEEVESMPPDLVEGCSVAIMELSGLVQDKTKKEDGEGKNAKPTVS